jgi:phosphate transport system substrate-binding protein
MALPLMTIALLAGCGGSELTSSVVVSGSSTVEPITIRVAEMFNDRDPTVDMLVDGPGTGDGFELFCNGEIDINDASSKIEDEQIEACEANGIEFIELPIGNDGIAAMTSAGNEAVDCLALADLYALVGPESQGFTRWSDANGLARALDGRDALPDLALSIIGPGEESGTFTSFVDLVIEDLSEERGQLPTTRPDYQASADDNVILQGVQGSPTSLGWTGFAFARGAEGVRLLDIDGGDGCVTPTDETIAGGDYPISRPLYLYVNAERTRTNPALAPFVDFYLSDEGIRAVGEVGYVGLAPDALDATRERWRSSVTGAA